MDDQPTPDRPAGRNRALAAVAAVAVLVAAGVIGAAALGGSDGDGSRQPGGSEVRSFEPGRGGVGDPFPSDPKSAHHYPVAHIRRSLRLYDRPGGKAKVRIAAKTEWGSPRVLAVARRRGSWLAVLAPELKNGRVGWIRRRDATTFDTVSWSLHVDLSKRLLVVRREGKTTRRIRVGVGRAGHSTPKGRFAVTDRLKVRDASSPYGCCVLALSGHQTRLPAGWPGGDRLAVHATSDLAGIGNAVSLGCMRARPEDARWLIATVPLGSPVFIRG